MLIRVGEERTARVDLRLAGMLSSVAGALNAVGFLIAGSFTANMTGNVSMFADLLVSGDILAALTFAGLVVTFILGATCAALVVQIGQARKVRSIYAAVIVAEGLALLALGLFFHPPTDGSRGLFLLVVLSGIMGVQNAVTTMISGAKVRTTHVSGMATDIGIELAATAGDASTKRDALPKLKLHSLTLACFVLGGLTGTLLYWRIGGWLFIVAGAILLAMSLPDAVRSRRMQPPL